MLRSTARNRSMGSRSALRHASMQPGSDVRPCGFQAMHGRHWRPFLLNLSFLSNSGNLEDRVYQTHWRVVSRCSGSWHRLGRDAVPCVKIEIEANSFMLNQIRHMIGVAVAITRGTLPLGFVEASLSLRARCACAPARQSSSWSLHFAP